MAPKCCVPFCKSNYDSTSGYVSVFKFPTDAELKLKWVKFIQRKGWVPSKGSVVCAKHFLSSDIIVSDKYTDKSGVEHILPRKNPALKINAFPTVFPGKFPDLQSDLSVKVHVNAGKTADILVSHKNSIHQQKVNERLSSDINSFENLESQIKSKLNDKFEQTLKCTSEDGMEKSPKQIETACGKFEDTNESKNADRSCVITSFQSRCREISRNSAPGLSMTSQNLEIKQEPQLSEEADYIALKLKFLEQQRKYIHTFTDHYIDRMITEGNLWTRNTVESRPDFADMHQSLDKGVFLHRMCDELLSTVTADITEGELTQLKDCKACLDLPDSASGDNSVSVTSTLDMGQSLKSGLMAGMRSCCSLLSQHSMLNKHLTESHTCGSCEKSQVINNTCAEYDNNPVSERENYEADESIKLEYVSMEGHTLVTESCDTQTESKISSQNGQRNQKQTSSHTDKKLHNSDGFTCLNLSWQQTHKQSFTSTMNISELTEARYHETKDENRDMLKDDKLHSENRNSDESLQEKNNVDKTKAETNVINKCPMARSRKKMCRCTVEKQYTCAICNVVFKSAASFQAHMVQHPGMKAFRCNVCDTSFTSKSYMDVHMRKHTGKKPYICGDCGAEFTIMRQLKVHRILHTGEKPYKCDVCRAGFNAAYTLRLHKIKHTGEKPYNQHNLFICEICGLKLSGSTSLQYHRRRHTGANSHKCDVCGMAFCVKSSLLNHQRKHTGETPYSCDICGLRFSVITSLQTHLRSHTGEKPYLCDICGTEFAYRGSLRDHKRLHTGEKPYRCGLCGEQFYNGKRLQSHRKVHSMENQ